MLSGHPHVGGEIASSAFEFHASHGPSPRGWGNPRNAARMTPASRAIPTWVGKSPMGSRHTMSRAGHPHVGGEITALVLRGASSGGPSPRGWGNPVERFTRDGCKRAIPTWVGKSTAFREADAIASGHPHVGGEISLEPPAKRLPPGPSPRGWGNLAGWMSKVALTRAIPTWVGKSLNLTAESSSPAGHPHVGGEITALVLRAASSGGPSPRGWGNPV